MSAPLYHGRTERVVLWLMDHWRWLLAFAAALLALSGYRTVLTYGSLRSDLEELLPQSAPSVSAIAELRRRLPGIRSLGVVIELDDPARAADAERFLERLAERIRGYPPDLVRSVRLDSSAERRFAERYALQLMDPADVRRLREAVEARRDFEVSRATGTDLDDDDPERKPPELPLDELKRKYEARFAVDAAKKSDRFVSADGRNLALLVQTSSQSTGSESDQHLLSAVIRDVVAIGGVPAGMRLGYAGDVATRVEEMQGLATDLGTSSAVVALLVILSLLWFYRSWSALVVLFVPLALGTCLGFALVALPPLSIRSLNTNTAFLGSIVVGNGINSGIVLLARIQEELGRGQSVRGAITTGVAQSFRATLAAALASAASYGSLVFTDFRGFNQFGWIGSIGIVLCWAAMYALMPPLCLLFGERLRPRERRSTLKVGPSISERLAAFTAQHRRVVLLGLLALGVVSSVGLTLRRGDWIEYDLSKLRRKDSWESGERYWGKRLDAATGRYLTPTVVMTERPADVAIVEQRLQGLMRSGGAGDLIAEVRSARQLLPETREAAIAEALLLEDAITPRLRAQLSENERQQLDRALSAESLVPLQAKDLPEAFAAGLRERDGQVGRSVLVFPKVGGGTWRAERLTSFAHDLRAVAAEVGATAAGPLLLSSDLAAAMRADGPRVTLLSFGCVLVICLGAFGVVGRQAWMFSGLSVATLLLGVVYMLGLLAWTGAKLNFSNFVALPITFGIGADYAINMLRRYQADGQSSEERLSRTSGALVLCSAMTVIGWGALLLVQNQALFSFGVFAISGELASLGAAVLALPAVLAWFTNGSAGSRSGHPDTAPTALG
ncbi:MAG TPA: MMPL family transporter [Polyangiaceae bacterium]|nr:MMPL family transporter [Polyangiaceae bacterium]